MHGKYTGTTLSSQIEELGDGVLQCRSLFWFGLLVVVVVEFLFRIADQTGRFAQYYDGDIIREVNSKEMKCLVHVVYHQ